ncbi:M48 family metallopeptidase [Streptomyces palmae]|uniref:M48 family metallopeptidase n=1 Tax=Streptomyces palmae TaxID=1701085 RepID=UPI001FD84DFF|nr:SprT family zinc-dependent metalloprotease [Streptomyces palmae]
MHVRVSARRGRLALAVERDGTVVLRAPASCDMKRAEVFVRAHAGWIADKARLRDRFRPAHPSRALVDGTAFRYLGREYRLLLVQGSEPTRLRAGRLRLGATAAANPADGRKAIIDWYQRAGTNWALGRFQPWAGRLEVREPDVEVRDLGDRWGAYTPDAGGGSGRMTLHWAIFQLPIRLVDYVIAHELAHVRISGHGPDYWRLLRRAIPECERLKDELDEMGRRVWLGETADIPPGGGSDPSA